jgi:carboxyl-terminal processing protease
VLSLLQDSPAAAANIQVGDVITKIDGAAVTGWQLSQVVDQLRGSSGSAVNLELQRSVPGGPPDRTVGIAVVVVRQKLEAVYLHTRLLENRIAYVRADQCYDILAEDLTAAVTTLTESAADNRSDTAVRGLVLDLRANPGGSLICAVTSVDLFIDSGTIVTTEGHRGTESYDATSYTPFASTALVVLVDGGTASAAEIIAGALQDYGRAVIVGGQTFGKGSVQTLLPPLANGSALKITTAHYRTPKGRGFSEVGLMPDIAVNSLDESAVLAAALQVIADQVNQAQTPSLSSVE